jgi:hypothetical protein
VPALSLSLSLSFALSLSSPHGTAAEDEHSVTLSSVTTGGDAQSLLPTDWQPVAASVTRPGSPPAASRASRVFILLPVWF